MFIKPFKQKSNVQLKASDYKKLRRQIQQSFPNLNEAELCCLLPNKSTVTAIKVIVNGGMNITIYSVDKRPMFFEDEDKKLIPTVYTLWVIPDILPYFTTHPSVLPRLANGADLMIPGVIPIGIGINMYGHYKKDTLMAVNLTSNKAGVGVGRLLRSSEDLYMSGGHGPCIKFLNIFGDTLWGIEPSVTLQIPNCEPVKSLPTNDDFPALGAKIEKPILKNVENILEKFSELDTESSLTTGDNNITESWEDLLDEKTDVEIQEKSMDDIIKSAFLTALKNDGKNLILPILTSNFYRLNVVPSTKEKIDLKKTSYKKLSKFLNEMSAQNFIVVREETKGIEKITSINFDHPDLIDFIPESNDNSNTELQSAQLFHVAMTELYVVTDETIAFFTKFNFKKGQGIPSVQIKKILKEYVSKSQLSYVDSNRKIIKLDSCLSEICNSPQYTLDEIYHMILSKMIHSFEMRGKNETNHNKSPINMSLATRSGNKKVTLVTNLESYGIILSEFSKVCKQGAAASTSIIKSPNQKQDQFQIQGNQIRFLYKLLTETYKIPAKQIHGLDLAKKEKKTKN